MIGVAITTKDRHDLLKKALTYHDKHWHGIGALIVVDDGSETPVQLPDWVGAVKPKLIRHEQSMGISAAKNRCLEALMAEPNCEHLFLFDDDSWPICDGWHKPYTTSPEPHLQANYAPAVSRWNQLWEIYLTPRLVAHHCGRGHMLYFKRKAIERVGGFDLRFKYGFEHLEVSERIYAAGLTSFPYQDVPKSEKYIHWADAEDDPPPSTIPRMERRLLNAENLALFESIKGRDTYVPYQQPRDIVLTCLFTTTPDPQWGHTWDTDPKIVRSLMQSLMVHGVESVTFYDDPRLEPLQDGWNTWQPIHRGVADPYIERWMTYRRWLVQHPEARWVWCVDGSDVELLQEPFAEMRPGVLYCGYEDEICAKPWMLKNHPASQEWLEDNATRTLLNPGVVGGDRRTVMELCDRIIKLYSWATVEGELDRRGDMGYAQRAIYAMNYETGPRIVTAFKRDERNDHSLWKHK